MSVICKTLCHTILLLLSCLSTLVVAAPATTTTTTPDPSCPNAHFFKHILTDTCWNCFFPIQLMGAKFGSRKISVKKPSNKTGGAISVTNNTVIGPDYPSSANTNPACVCYDNLGVPKPGFTLGAWLPVNLTEIVRTPYCSPTLGGVKLNPGIRLLGGSRERDGPGKLSFYQYHYFAYPAMFMLDLLSEPECNPDGYLDMDLMFISELDPTWNEDELSLLVVPEEIIFSNPIALAACIGDAVSSTAGHPLDKLFWCAGGWGLMYPLTGHLTNLDSPPTDAALLTTRVLATLHRRGMAYATVGDSNLCKAHFSPMIPKSQYKMSQFYPVAEANSNHWIGQSSFTWGEWRNVPATGEDFVEVIWRWTDCCIR